LHKRQFKTRLPPHTFFDRKVTHLGQSRVISISKFVPKTWDFVRVSIIDRTSDGVTIKITRLQVREIHAQDNSDDTTGESDT